MRSVSFIALAAALAVGPGCTDSSELSSTERYVLEDNRIISNRIISNQITLNRIISNRIISNQITTNRFELNTATAAELLKTAESRELLTYIVQCALPVEVQLEATYEGVRYEFHGDVGLAPRWLKRDLRDSEQRWVSACLIARVNKTGTSVSISIRGPNDALVVSETEAADFTVEEGAFYGDVFEPAHKPIIWVACRGRDQATSELGSLGARQCTEPDPANPGKTLCGFTYAGDCADFSPPKSPYACKRFVPAEGDGCDDDLRAGVGVGVGDDAARALGDDDDGAGDAGDEGSLHEGGYYAQCHDAPGSGRWPGAKRFKEVITVFLQP